MNREIMSHCVYVFILLTLRNNLVDSFNNSLDLQSTWPVGPYALPMSKYGCPEDDLHGWSLGYINISLVHPINITFWKASGQTDNSLEKNDKTKINYMENIYLKGPFGDNCFQLNFCFKSAYHPNNAANTFWPKDVYSIYGDKDGCPQGFEHYIDTIKLPRVLRWNMDGNLPIISIEETSDKQVTLTFSMCRRLINTSDDNILADQQDYECSTPFVLMKESHFVCPNMDGLMLTEITLDVQQNRGSIIDIQYCMYRPYNTTRTELNSCESSHVYKTEKEATLTLLMETARHIFSSIPHYEEVRESLVAYQTLVQTTWLDNDILPWLLYDLGYIVKVYGVQILWPKDQLPWVNNLVSDMIIYVSNSRWGFLHHSVDICTTVDFVFVSLGNDVEFPCWRPIQGRYVSIQASNKDITNTGFIYMQNVFIKTCNSKETSQAEPKMCHRALGMEDGGIKDFQISSSSQRLNYKASMSRPGAGIWCADSNDTIPYLQIDFLTETLLEGLVIVNWLQTQSVEDESQCLVQGTPLGCLSFYVMYGTEIEEMKAYKNRSFYIDTSLPYSEPKTFLFSNPISARYVRVFPDSLLSDNNKCLSVEIIGCRRPDMISLQCQNDSARMLVPVTGNFLPLQYTDWFVTKDSLNDPLEYCKTLCLDDPICGAVDYDSSTSICRIYTTSPTKRYYHIPGPSKTIFLPVCLKEAETLGPLLNKSNDFIFPNGTDFFIYISMIITNPGYPFPYDTLQAYRWNIQLVNKYVTLMFTNISLHTYETMENKDLVSEDQICTKDKIFISHYEYVYEYKKGGLPKDAIWEFDNRYNGRIPTFATQYTDILLTFMPCARSSPRIYNGQGFRVIVRAEDIATCVALTTYGEGTNFGQFCELSTMVLVSHSFLDFIVPSYFAESWTVVPSTFGIIAITFLDFDVRCDQGVTFKVTHPWGYKPEETYCNMNKPPSPMYSAIEGLTIHLETRQTKYGHYNQGFKAIYKALWVDEDILSLVTKNTNMDVAIESLPFTLYNENDDWTTVVVVHEACSDRLRKCYYLLSYEANWQEAKLTCDSLGKTMVAIGSQLEMRLVRYLLENYTLDMLRRWGLQEIMSALYYIETPSLYAYIGLYRTVASNGELQESWDDGSKVTYSAWDTNEPSDTYVRHCTKMWFAEMRKENSWRTDTCDKRTASMIVCENSTHITEGVSLGHRHSAENNFIQQYIDPSFLFRCTSGEWLIIYSVCDGIPECLDKSDETNCETSEIPCDNDGFRCKSGRCISIDFLCNFIPDCDEAEDEYCEFPTCDSESEFRCTNGQCINITRRCDAKADCSDNTDEINCLACKKEKAFLCSASLTCISQELTCDNFPDCIDERDEKLCDSNTKVTSCVDVLEKGLTQSGIYDLGGFLAECDFSKISSNQKIIMTINNMDIVSLEMPGYLNDIILFPGNADKIKINREKWREEGETNDYNCTLTSSITCEPFMYSLMDIEKNDCTDLCVVIESDYHSYRSREDRRYCNSSVPFTDDLKIITDTSDITFVLTKPLNNTFRIRPGPFSCEIAYNKNANLFACESEGRKTVTLARRCLYDVDNAGHVIGCRWLSHLANCEEIGCPIGYVKCPNTYCVAERLICDGEKHCPHGEDEDYCWCKDEPLQLVIVHKSDTNLAKNSNIYKFAKQFADRKEASITRLSYTVKRGEDNEVSEDNVYITETDIADRIVKNQYSVPNPAFLGNIVATFKNSKLESKNAIILINSPELLQSESSLTWRYKGRIVHIYSVTENRSNNKSVRYVPQQQFIDIKIRHLRTLEEIGALLFPDLCYGSRSDKVKCVNRYRCGGARICIPSSQVCDAIVHCPHGDDELFCEFICPAECSCEGYKVHCSGRIWNTSNFYEFPETARKLDLSLSVGVEYFMINVSTHFPYMTILNISRCDLQVIFRSMLSRFKNLLILDLGNNGIKVLPRYVFRDLRYVRDLYLAGNSMLEIIESYAFYGLENLKQLTVKNTMIKTIPANAFKGLNIDMLDISDNSITTLEDFAFNDLEARYLNFEGNDIPDISYNTFTGLRSVELLRTSAFRFCCVRPEYMTEINCLPHKDAFSSCADLMRSTVLQTLLWIIGLLALLGNCISLLYRFKYERDGLKFGYRIFVTNLALADLCMGLYLIIIAIADLIFKNRYILNDLYWRNSFWCKLSGVLSTTSSEASVLFICLITLDRIFVIKYPFGQVRFSTSMAIKVSITVWCIALFIALFPFMLEEYFQGTFYTKTAVCVALPLSTERPPGWLYSITIFIGINFVTFVLIAIGQLMIFKEIKQHSSKMKKVQGQRKSDLKIARNLLIVVTTDFLCWFPIGCMGLMTMQGQEISGDVYAWAAVLILPVNSALNPFLYTLSALISKQTFAPRLSEQSQQLSTKEIALHMLRLWDNRSLFRYTNSITKHVRSGQIQIGFGAEVDLGSTKISVLQVTAMCVRLTRCLRFLHGYDLVHGRVNEDCLVMFNKTEKNNGTFSIRVQPKVCGIQAEKTQDIYNMGCLIRKLIRETNPRNIE